MRYLLLLALLAGCAPNVPLSLYEKQAEHVKELEAENAELRGKMAKAADHVRRLMQKFNEARAEQEKAKAGRKK